jgi:hypothetical protein
MVHFGKRFRNNDSGSPLLLFVIVRPLSLSVSETIFGQACFGFVVEPDNFPIVLRGIQAIAALK